MTVFQQARLWARRASLWQRATGLVGAVLVVVVLAWVLVPTDDDGDNAVFGAGQGTTPVAQGQAAPLAEGESGAAGATDGSVVPADGSGTVGSDAGSGTGGGSTSAGGSVTDGGANGTSGGSDGSGGSTTADTGGGCVSPPGSDVGATDKEIKLAIVLLNLVGPAGNNTFGIPGADIQRDNYETVIKAVNASGGIACRKVVPAFWEANPADQSQLQRTCQDVIAAKPFFTIAGAYGIFPELASCFPTNGIPVYTAWMSAKLQQEYYPYLFTESVLDILYRNTVLALKQRGFFDAANGFKKLGFIYRDCQPQYASQYIALLRQVGLPASQIVAYNLGCPPGFVPPSVLSQAVLTFRQEGVTHASALDVRADFPNFTTIAEQQGFRPKWGIPDDGVVGSSYGTTRPNPDNLTDAIAITANRFGEERTPGYPASVGTAKCDAIFKAAGDAPVYQHQAGFGGQVCSQLWTLKAAAEHAPVFQRRALADGLRASGSFESSYPYGPNDFRPNAFTGSKITYGSQFWRANQFKRGCSCWQVIERDWRPSFQ